MHEVPEIEIRHRVDEVYRAESRRVLATLVKKHEAAALTPDGARHMEQFAAPRPLARRT